MLYSFLLLLMIGISTFTVSAMEESDCELRSEAENQDHAIVVSDINAFAISQEALSRLVVRLALKGQIQILDAPEPVHMPHPLINDEVVPMKISEFVTYKKAFKHKKNKLELRRAQIEKKALENFKKNSLIGGLLVTSLLGLIVELDSKELSIQKLFTSIGMGAVIGIFAPELKDRLCNYGMQSDHEERLCTKIDVLNAILNSIDENKLHEFAPDGQNEERVLQKPEDLDFPNECKEPKNCKDHDRCLRAHEKFEADKKNYLEKLKKHFENNAKNNETDIFRFAQRNENICECIDYLMKNKRLKISYEGNKHESSQSNEIIISAHDLSLFQPTCKAQLLKLEDQRNRLHSNYISLWCLSGGLLSVCYLASSKAQELPSFENLLNISSFVTFVGGIVTFAIGIDKRNIFYQDRIGYLKQEKKIKTMLHVMEDIEKVDKYNAFLQNRYKPIVGQHTFFGKDLERLKKSFKK